MEHYDPRVAAATVLHAGDGTGVARLRPRPAARSGNRLPAPLAPLLVVAASCSIQLGGALATTLFARLGVIGAASLRMVAAAVILLAVARPRLRGRSRAAWRDVVALGLIMAVMNAAFFGAIARLPLGVASTIDFLGPLAVALAGSRRRVDVAWVALAFGGVLLLARDLTGSTSTVGVALALVSAVTWAAYIPVAKRVGEHMRGLDGLALATAVAGVVLAPLAAGSGAAHAPASLLAIGVAVAVLNVALPYALEIEALRRLRAATFGILLSLEPAIAAAIGLAALGQRPTVAETAGVALVVAASAGAVRTHAG
jgi:inner membrane transporter RhtA